MLETEALAILRALFADMACDADSGYKQWMQSHGYFARKAGG
jgi:hypothetical protein